MDNRTDRIQQRAFALWKHEGRPEGRAWDNWLQAEAEIDSEAASPKRKQATARKKSAAGSAPKARGRKRA